MNEWLDFLADSKQAWEKNAEFWDNYMGEDSNLFHRKIIRPPTERLLAIAENDLVLDIACGNGNFSKRLCELGAKVVAFDYSEKMIQRAQKRCAEYKGQISFSVLDATDYASLIALGKLRFDKAVANMALMDIADIKPLLQAVFELLKDQGIFVFSIMHPCFQAPGTRKVYEEEEQNNSIISSRSIQVFNYISSKTYQGVGIKNQPVASRYFHRPLSVLLDQCFASGFVCDGIAEEVFDEQDVKTNGFDWVEIPPAIIIRLRKI